MVVLKLLQMDGKIFLKYSMRIVLPLYFFYQKNYASSRKNIISLNNTGMASLRLLFLEGKISFALLQNRNIIFIGKRNIIFVKHTKNIIFRCIFHW